MANYVFDPADKAHIWQKIKHWNSDDIFKLLYSENDIIRFTAAQELQMRGDDRIFDRVISLLSDSRSYVKEIALFTLGQFGGTGRPYKQKTIHIIMNMIKDKDNKVKSAAIIALGHLFLYADKKLSKEEESMPRYIEEKIISFIYNKDTSIKCSVAFALGCSSGSQDTVDALKILLLDRNKEVRSWAETGLEMLSEDII